MIIDTDFFPDFYNPFTIQKMINFDFVVGDFENLSYLDVSFKYDYYEEIIINDEGLELVTLIPYIKDIYQYVKGSFSSLTCDGGSTFVGSLKLRQNTQNIFIFPEDNLTVNSIQIGKKSNINDYFTSSKFDEIFNLSHYDYYLAGYFNDYVSHFHVLPSFSSSVDMKILERFFINIELAYGRQHKYSKDIIKYLNERSNYFYNPTFWDFVSKYNYNGLESLKYYNSKYFYDEDKLLHDGTYISQYLPMDFFSFDFRQLFSNKFKFDNLDFEKTNIIHKYSSSFSPTALVAKFYNLASWANENYRLFKAGYGSRLYYNDDFIVYPIQYLSNIEAVYKKDDDFVEFDYFTYTVEPYSLYYIGFSVSISEFDKGFLLSYFRQNEITSRCCLAECMKRK